MKLFIALFVLSAVVLSATANEEESELDVRAVAKAKVQAKIGNVQMKANLKVNTKHLLVKKKIGHAKKHHVQHKIKTLAKKTFGCEYVAFGNREFKKADLLVKSVASPSACINWFKANLKTYQAVEFNLKTSTCRAVKLASYKNTVPSRVATIFVAKPNKATPSKSLQWFHYFIKHYRPTIIHKPVIHRTDKPKLASTTAKRPTTAKPVRPTTAKPVRPTTAKPVRPTTAKPVRPTTAKPARPTTAKPVRPTTAKPAQSTTAKPAQPITAKLAQPTTAKPAQPTTAKPTTAKPTTAKPTTAKPTTAKPTTAKPTTAKPTTAKPTTAKPTTAKPAQPTTAKPVQPTVVIKTVKPVDLSRYQRIKITKTIKISIKRVPASLKKHLHGIISTAVVSPLSLEQVARNYYATAQKSDKSLTLTFDNWWKRVKPHAERVYYLVMAQLKEQDKPKPQPVVVTKPIAAKPQPTVAKTVVISNTNVAVPVKVRPASVGTSVKVVAAAPASKSSGVAIKYKKTQNTKKTKKTKKTKGKYRG